MNQFFRRHGPFLAGLLCAIIAYMGLCGALGFNPVEHSYYDSYTLQAMRWRAGDTALTENYPWLEIAQYQGRYFISFPPFPSVPMYLLTFLFGENTPSRLVTCIYFMLGYVFGYLLARRHGAQAGKAATLSLFLVCGCNMMEFGLQGGVWNMAQTLGFLLTLVALWGAGAKERYRQYIGLIAIACAVGCRPFQALYVPLLLHMIYDTLRGQGKTRARR